jgi:hypothetical protein
MAGAAVPDCGGACVPDTGGGQGGGSPPPGIMDLLGKFGQKGVVISGIVTWISAQIDTQTTDAWKSLADFCLLEEEVTAAKEALRNASGDVLAILVTEFKTKRSGVGKKVTEIDALVALHAANEMPLVLASSAQMVRCPQSWGVPATATVQDLMGKVIMLEQVVSNNIESQKEQMEQMREELVAVKRNEARTPSFTQIVLNGDTPSKKRKVEEVAQAKSQESPAVKPSEISMSYANVAGVQPLLQHLLGLRQQNQSRPQRNILFGSAKTSGEGASAQETMLAADVSLVASGVGKGCTTANLTEFLKGKGINPVEVEMLTKAEVVNEVRTLTFRIAVKPEEYEKALKPEVWPYRVAVRHYKAPKRERTAGSWERQSEQSGGQINLEQANGYQARAGGGAQRSPAPGYTVPIGQASVGGGRSRSGAGPYLPPGHSKYGGQHQQLMGKQPGSLQLSNLFEALAALNGGMGPP